MALIGPLGITAQRTRLTLRAIGDPVGSADPSGLTDERPRLLVPAIGDYAALAALFGQASGAGQATGAVTAIEVAELAGDAAGAGAAGGTLTAEARLSGTAAGTGAAAGELAWTPQKLFLAGEVGFWFDPSDLSTLFVERTGAAATTPSGVGTVVGTILDKSGNGNHAVAALDAARPILRQDGAGRYYLEFDGVDDQLSGPSLVNDANWTATVGMAIPSLGGPASVDAVFGLLDGSLHRSYLGIRRSGAGGGSQIGADIRISGGTLYRVSQGNAYTPGELFVGEAWHAADILSVRKNGGAANTLAANLGGASSSGFVTCGIVPMTFYGGVYTTATISDADRSKLRTFMGKKVGLAL